ncbi:MAG: AMP-binding protein [Pseudomonadales bacterium]|jgi:fatty-acyl-CoA synthase
MTTLSYRCGEAKTPLLYETIGEHFDRIAEAHRNREALVVAHQGIRWTYGEYAKQVDALATGLLALGLGPGDRIGIWAPNCVEWCLTQMATAKIGAIMVCINPAYRVHELEYALTKVGCRAIIAAERFKTSDYLGMLEALAPELAHCAPGALKSAKLPELEIVIRLGEGATPGMLNFPSVCALGGEAERSALLALTPTLSPDDPINIQFTSGTTGNPKGATLTHFNILNNGAQVGAGQNLTAEDRVCIPVPLYHCFGMVMGMLGVLTHGATAVLPSDAFEAETVLRVVEAERCTSLYGVPTMFVGMLEAPNFSAFDLSALRTGIMAGALCPVEVMKRANHDMHMGEVIICYGQTETSPVNHMTAIDAPFEKRVSTVGQCGPHQEVKVIDEDGRMVPLGAKGELCCRGYSVMRGYWGDEERTAETIDEAGWLHSGDLAVMDEEGYVQIVGRLKDMIIRGGENIYPKEVEEFLYTHPAIQEAQVFGVPDPKFGEQVAVWIQLREGTTLTEDEVRSFCAERIAHFKVPKYIAFVDAFPMTVTGKIQKFVMRDALVAELGLSA